VPHTETAEQVEVDMDYQKTMLALHLRANPREVLLGWYATSSVLNTFSALIQNFYAGQQAGEGTWPHPAIHLTVSTEPGKDIGVQTYISVPIGVTEERSMDSCSFIPVPHEVKYGEADKSGLELISSAKDDESRSALVATDLDSLEKAVVSVLDMLERVSTYVSNVLDEDEEANSSLGQFLMNTLSLAPKVDPANIERDLYVTSPVVSYYKFANVHTAATTFKTCLSCRTWPIRYEPRSICPTGSLPLRLRSAAEKLPARDEETVKKVVKIREKATGTDNKIVPTKLNRAPRHLHEIAELQALYYYRYRFDDGSMNLQTNHVDNVLISKLFYSLQQCF
jgi:hypothetical protein